jgi:hypothetical protein
LPRRAVAAFAVVLALGVAFLVWRAASTDSTVAFRVGPGPTPVATIVPPRAEVCQTPIEVLADTRAVELWVRTSHPGAPLAVMVRDLRGRPLGRDRVTVGPGHPAPVQASFARIREGTSIALCVRNLGAAPVAASGGQQEPDAGTLMAGQRRGSDLTLVFLRERPRSDLGLVPTMFRRAALFRFGWVGAWTFWVLAALVLLVVPALCAFALARAARDQG